MCIIAVVPTGVKMPGYDTIRNMWMSNSDGAGLMYTRDGKVCIDKGYMKYKAFEKRLRRLEGEIDTTEEAVVLHFRIETHGGKCPENCHPFPISSAVEDLRLLKTTTDIGVAHNGIIYSVTPRKGISDTMEYIASQLAPLKKGCPDFLERESIRTMIYNAIYSKMAFLTGDRTIYLLGSFINEGGIQYSNSTYMSYQYATKLLTNKDAKYDDYDDIYYGSYSYTWDYNGKDYKTTKRTISDSSVIELMMLDPDRHYVVTPKGTFVDAYDYLIDADGNVYYYDYKTDAVSYQPAYTARCLESCSPPIFEAEFADLFWLAKPRKGAHTA